MATGSTANYSLPYPLSTDPVNVSGDIEQLAVKIDNDLQEIIQDTSALMWTTGGTFNNGLQAPTYNDSTGKMSMSLTQDLQTSASPTFVNLTLTGDANVNGGNINTTQTTFNLLNSTATNINFAGSASSLTIGATSGSANIRNATVTLDGDLAVNGGDITSTQTSFNLLDLTTTSINFAGSASTLTIGATTGTATIRNADVVLSGDLEVRGGDLTTNQTTFNLINSTATTLNIGGSASVIAIGSSSSQINAAGDMNVATGKVYKVNNTEVLSSTTLGSGVVSSSLTSVGTIATGVWNATTIAVNKGGTGLTSYAIGDIVYASASATLAKLTIGSNNFVLTSDGSAPVWTTNTGTGNVVRAESPTLSGSPLSTTASVDTNTTQIATTAFVVGQAGSASPTMDGIATVGTSLRYSRQDHIHPTDTTRASVASPTFTGTVSSEGTEIIMSSDTVGSPTDNVLFTVKRGSSPDVALRWNEAGDTWQFTNDGTVYIDIGSGGGGGGVGLESVLMFAGM